MTKTAVTSLFLFICMILLTEYALNFQVHTNTFCNI